MLAFEYLLKSTNHTVELRLDLIGTKHPLNQSIYVTGNFCLMCMMMTLDEKLRDYYIYYSSDFMAFILFTQNHKCQPAGAAKRRVRGSPKSLGFMNVS